MFTIEYKGWFIHGYYDKPECRVMKLLKGEQISVNCKSMHAAKMYITKQLTK
jgi:hypothetical protein